MHRWLEHTGEAALEITAPTEREVFAEALAALSELMGGPGENTPSDQREYRVEAAGAGRPALLLGWLEELLWLAEGEGVFPLRVSALDLGTDGLRASVIARPGPANPLVKAVTWHELAFEPDGNEYRARVVFDV